nr:carboxypeptidase-like regulatory domain-containing protein [Pedobacter panaciterrae]
MKLKYALIIFFILSGVTFLAFVSKDEDPVERILTSLQNWVDNNPQEKVYLHTDKPYYVVGDTIWFKAYVTIGSKHQLSALSGTVYVDLINEGDSLTKALKLPLLAGMAKGSIVLSDGDIREGNYRLRAYTQWMRNAGPEYFYDRTFSIGNSVINTVFAKIDYIYTKEKEQTKIRALIKYADQEGNPYAEKSVVYELKEGFKSIATGGGKTNALGELSINVPSAKLGKGGSAYVLTKITIADGETVPKSFPIKVASQETDVQFFPEGGNLVNDILSRIGVKAVGANGLGVNVKGIIIDNENKEVGKLETEHLGMGYFNLKPEQGKTYQAKITYPDGSVNTLKLPKASNDGYVLSVYNNVGTDTVLVKIAAGSSVLQKGNQSVSLVSQSGGEVQYVINVPVTKAGAVVPIPLKSFSTGVLQFTLFSKSGEPLNERIVFVQNNDQMDLRLNSKKKEYSSREKVELNLEAKDAAGKPLIGNFSVSVINEDAVPSDETNENSIYAQLLLSSDIKGYIERPNYYFNNPTKETKANLDILMLTQGYRRFTWKSLISGKQVMPKYKAEKLITNITGRLVSLSNKPVAGGKVILTNNKLGVVLDTVSDKNGQFEFSNLLITEGVDFTIQGRTVKDGKRLEVQVDKVSGQEVTPNMNIGDVNADIPKLLMASIQNSIKQDQDMQKHGRMGRDQQLKEVRIQASKLPKYGITINESQADQVFRPDSRQPCGSFKDCLEKMNNNKSVRFDLLTDEDCGPVWVPRSISDGRYAVTIDGMAIAGCDFQDLLLGDGSNISKVYFVYNSAAASMRLLGGRISDSKPPPVMAIYTRNGNFRAGYNPSVVYYAPIGFSAVKEFYAPNYDTPDSDSPLADLRSTIYWNPATVTDKEGKAKLIYFNSDNKGTYRVTVEGINADGLLGRQVYRYEVK